MADPAVAGVAVRVDGEDDFDGAADSGLARDEIAFMGDDLTDVVCFRRCGLAIAVANAAPEVKACAHFTTQTPGGQGALREVTEMLLKAQGKWAAILSKYEIT